MLPVSDSSSSDQVELQGSTSGTTDSIADAHYHDDPRLGADLAAALNQEILALADAGCRHIQVDEPVFARKPQQALDYGIDNLERCFHGLPAGRYAVRAFHDEDGDGDLGMDQGYPLEGYATSNASGRFDDPDFDEAVVTEADVALRLYYLN